MDGRIITRIIIGNSCAPKTARPTTTGCVLYASPMGEPLGASLGIALTIIRRRCIYANYWVIARFVEYYSTANSKDVEILVAILAFQELTEDRESLRDTHQLFAYRKNTVVIAKGYFARTSSKSPNPKVTEITKIHKTKGSTYQEKDAFCKLKILRKVVKISRRWELTVYRIKGTRSNYLNYRNSPPV